MKFLNNIANKLFGKSQEKPPDARRKFRLRNSIIGKTGKTLTPLARTGVIEVEGKEFEAESLSGYIKINIPVKIVGKHMSWLLVEPLR